MVCLASNVAEQLTDTMRLRAMAAAQMPEVRHNSSPQRRIWLSCDHP
jgi:hypothetical protein